ncbi:rRNA maturation RNase YbeY [Spiroplasma endosymbiont of Panorpa germanica]|uniref:rRNA maturation RNase YbeY n=1 Tax=Spiroplasma endosymbiont of Panorpa germanica TaxID=3066314 RepID=UPI0030CEA25C
MHELVFNNLTDFEIKGFEDLYKSIFKAAVKVLKISDSLSLSINFIDEQEAKRMNIFYRKRDYVPDVLSFNVDTSYNPEYRNVDEAVELGDIFICQQEAERKAVRYNHLLKEEMAFLFVHGFLHLFGLDHEKSAEEEKRMFDYQDEILREVDLEYKITFDELDYLRG